MSKSGIDFFKHHREAEAPPAQTVPPRRRMFPYCVNADSLDHPDCYVVPNPAWGMWDTVYCGACAPPELKNPVKFLKENNNVDLD